MSKKDSRGTRSYQARTFLQDSQTDLDIKTDSPLGILSIKTFKKLPKKLPIRNKKNGDK